MKSIVDAKHNALERLIIWGGIIAATIALAMYIYLGVFTRYMADDYCLQIDLEHGNLLTASLEKYITSSNRFSNLFVIGVPDLFGPGNIRYVPGVLILLWVVGLAWLGGELAKSFKIPVSWPLVLLAAELVAVLTFYQLPNLFQSLYWRPGQVSYFTPVVLFTLLFAGLVRASRMQIGRALFWLAPLFACLAFFIGGLSETLGAFHITALVLAIAGVLFFEQSPRRSPALILLFAALTGALLALAAMFLSPANAIRLEGDDAARDLAYLIVRIRRYAVSFTTDTLLTRPLPSIVSLALAFLLTYLFFGEEVKGKYPYLWTALIAIPLINFTLDLAVVAPSAYGQSYPVERVRFPAHYAYTLTLMSLGAVFAIMAGRIRLPKFSRTIALALLAIALLYPLWTIRQTRAMAAELSEWSYYWDQRELTLYEMIAEGQTDLMIPALPGMYSTKELDVRGDFWVNQCAAKYYRVNSIRANPVPDEYFDEYFNR